jgi:hypothetical protein
MLLMFFNSEGEVTSMSDSNENRERFIQNMKLSLTDLADSSSDAFLGHLLDACRSCKELGPIEQEIQDQMLLRDWNYNEIIGLEAVIANKTAAIVATTNMQEEVTQQLAGFGGKKTLKPSEALQVGNLGQTLGKLNSTIGEFRRAIDDANQNLTQVTEAHQGACDAIKALEQGIVGIKKDIKDALNPLVTEATAIPNDYRLETDTLERLSVAANFAAGKEQEEAFTPEGGLFSEGSHSAPRIEVDNPFDLNENELATLQTAIHDIALDHLEQQKHTPSSQSNTTQILTEITSQLKKILPDNQFNEAHTALFEKVVQTAEFTNPVADAVDRAAGADGAAPTHSARNQRKDMNPPSSKQNMKNPENTGLGSDGTFSI